VITDNKLFAQIPAVAKGGLVTLNNDMDVLAISATSPLSIQWTIDKLVPKLAAGAKAATGK
jgi:iron complex transport system substrate-binding protein